MTKLKYSDIKNKNKVLIDVKWSKLSGNKDPYLSVNILQVIYEGKRVHSWDDQKLAIEQLDIDLSFLCKAHLTDSSGYGMHSHSNTLYYFELTKQHSSNLSGKTKEEYQLMLDSEKSKIKDLWAQFIRGLKLSCDPDSWYNEHFQTRLDNPYRPLDTFRDNITKLAGGIGVNNVTLNKKIVPKTKALTHVIHMIEVYRKKVKTLTEQKDHVLRKSDVWIVERFPNYSGISKQQIQALAFEPDYKNIIKRHIDAQAKIIKNKLAILTEKYNIELVTQ